MEKTYSFGMTKEQFDSMHSFQIPADEEIVAVAEDMLNGKMLLRGTNFYTGYDIYNFDWEYCPADNTKESFQLNLFALYPLVYCIKAFD